MKTYGDTDRVIGDVRAERNRQQNEEGWTPAHDDSHTGRELALAAFSYVGHAADVFDFHDAAGVPETWPWDRQYFKPKNYRRDLVKAAALIVAEIERLDRASIEKLSKALPADPAR